jgi:hypothetical protein
VEQAASLLGEKSKLAACSTPRAKKVPPEATSTSPSHRSHHPAGLTPFLPGMRLIARQICKIFSKNSRKWLSRELRIDNYQRSIQCEPTRKMHEFFMRIRANSRPVRGLPESNSVAREAAAWGNVPDSRRTSFFRLSPKPTHRASKNILQLRPLAVSFHTRRDVCVYRETAPNGSQHKRFLAPSPWGKFAGPHPKLALIK